MLHKNCIRISLYIQRNLSVKMSKLETLKFDNLALRKLPIDPIKENYVRVVNGACFSKIDPTPVDRPELVAYSPSALSLLDLNLSETDANEFVEYFSGNKKLPGSETAAHCYCGHQFGAFAGQLGDGTVVYLGEVINSKNERWEIQLKGAGKTPFSRTSDGRKVLRSSIREFLCSEAMHFLGIPTTRAGMCITSQTMVSRDVLYNGRPIDEKNSIVLRIAPTFLRFGSFEIFTTYNPVTKKFGPSVGRLDILHTMLEYVIETFYPEIHSLPLSPVEKYEEFYKEVVLRTARLVALWQSVGFCHGVLNTDNMSILGLTMDYGPFGFLDIYDPHHVCNASDVGCRYTFSSQPEICKWNLRKFAEAIQQALPLSTSSVILEMFEEEFQTTYLNKMRAKLGLISTAFPEDKELIDDLLSTMEMTGADYTNTFISLIFYTINKSKLEESDFNLSKELITEYCYSRETLINYYKPDFSPGQLFAFREAIASNPEIANHPGREGKAIRRVIDLLRKTDEFEDLRTEDRKEKRDNELWTCWLRKYQRRIEKDMKSFSGDAMAYDFERQDVIKSNNPGVILRNFTAQEAIEKAEKGDYTHVQELLKTLEEPYEHAYSETIKQIYAKDEFYLKQKASAKRNEGWIPPTHLMFDRPPPSSFSIKIT